MSAADFAHIETWIFDLDNTLYHPEVRLFDQIEKKMVAWIMRELRLNRDDADRLRSRYWAEHGTTLSGLMAEHRVDPWDFLLDVHDIDFGALLPDATLRERIESLPGRSIVFTNGDTPYAERVLGARGLDGVFDAIYGIEHTNWRPKPSRDAFDAIVSTDGFEPSRAAMFEDDARNLSVPHKIGMRTVHVAPEPEQQIHVHHHTHDLTDFLSQLAAPGFQNLPSPPS